MDKTEEIKEYLKKLNLLITKNSEFTFIDVNFVKKSKVDDLLCCFLAVLPDKYKKCLKTPEGKKLTSIINYNTMIKTLVRPFFFNRNFYIVDYKSVSACINRIISNIDRDIAYVEKMER